MRASRVGLPSIVSHFQWAQRLRARHARFSFRFAFFAAMFGCSASFAAGPAGIKLDGTLGGAAQVLSGPNYNIAQSLGKLSGGNLFFSFQYFNVATNEIAQFSTTSPGINNVISRVTGGFASTIDGTISLTAAHGAPNFFFINPSGVTFTANAAVDVPAAFYVTTANYLKFSDGSFYADPAKPSTLSAAAPEAFGFLGTSRAPVNLLGATLYAGPVGDGKFEVVAGDVTIDGGGLQAGIVNSTGAENVTAIGNEVAEVPLSGPFAATDGLITIRDGGVLATQTSTNLPGGAIYVNAGNLLIDGNGKVFRTAIASESYAAGAGGAIVVTVGADTSIVNGGDILSENYASGNAGDISLTSKALEVSGQGLQNLQSVNPNSAAMGILSDTSGAGDAGNVRITANSLTVNGGGAPAEILVASQTDPGSSGSAGQVLVNVSGRATIANGGSILSATQGSGNAGLVAVTAGSLDIDALGNVATGTGITSNTSSTGNGGNVRVTAGTLVINGTPSDGAFTGISSDASTSPSATPNITGSGGAVVVDITNTATLTNNGEISSSAYYATGNAGSVTVEAGGMVSLASGGSIVSSTLYGPGSAGDVNLNAAGLSIEGQNVKFPTGLYALSAVGGNAGNITVNVGSLFIDGGGSAAAFAPGLGSETLGLSGTTYDTHASAGRISVTVSGSATVQNGGEISTTSETLGPAGSVVVNAANLTVGGVGAGADIQSRALQGSGGEAGTVTISVGKLDVLSNGIITIENDATIADPTTVRSTAIGIRADDIVLNGGVISAASTGNIDASTINLQFSKSLQVTTGAIATSAYDGNGGPISISGSGVMRLDGAQITTSVSGPAGNGGDIDISVPLIVMNTAAIQANTAAQKASGGDIKIDAQAIIPSFQSYILGGTQQNFDPTLAGQNLIQAAAPDGVSGTLDVTTPTLDIGSSLLALTRKAQAPIPLGRSPCGFTRGSSLSVTGRGGLPPSASDPLWIDVGGADHATARADLKRSSERDAWPINAMVSHSPPPCQ